MKKAIFLTLALLLASTSTALAAATEKVIFSFNLTDGNLPNAGLIADAHGNLYGTTSYNGGKYGFGNVFELTPTADGKWKETVLHDFTGQDGAYPLDSLIFGAAGNLYGTAQVGGQGKCTNTGLGCGVVFKLSHGKTGWKETVLYSFVPGKTKGVIPVGGLVFDSQGNLYGTTWAPGVLGGPLYSRRLGNSPNTFWGCNVPGCGGTVYKLAPTKTGWKETDIYAFTGAGDGSSSQASLIFDKAGNLFGTTVYGGTTGCASGYGCGVVFEVKHSTKGWKQFVLYRFTGAADGAYPSGSLLFDLAGNLLSTAMSGGTSNKGTVFKLSNASGHWKEHVLYTFTGGPDGGTPAAAVILDGNGNIYGTTEQGGDAYQSGVAFELVSGKSGWTEKVLHTFTYGHGDGQSPAAPMIFSPKGHLFGTTQTGGASTIHGAVFEITP